MKKRTRYLLGLFVYLVCSQFFPVFSAANDQATNSNGVRPLLQHDGHGIHRFIPESTQALVLTQEIEHFLKKLDGDPPDWTQLGHPDISQQSERLFQFNRQRDTARADKNILLEQPIAFLWTGILRQYLPEFQGFSIALGPELTNSSWGIIRFKPMNLPDYLVAIPSPELQKQLLNRQKRGAKIEIIVVCIGTLVPDESLIYGFSHDDHQKGMIMPVVSVQDMVYILKQP